MREKNFILVIFMLGTMIGCAQKNKDLDLKGGLYMKGSAPHTYLVIEDQISHTDYKIKNAKEFSLNMKQEKVVELKVKLIKKAIAPGWPAVVEVVKVK